MVGGEWTTLELMTLAKMNQKTVCVSDTEPATMYAGMIWIDTTAGAVKVRNATNNAWAISIVNIIDLTCSGILKTTGDYLGVGDLANLLYKKAGYYAFINQPLVLQGGLSIGGASGGGAPAWGGTEVISSARALANVTANASIINAGTFDIARIPTMDAAHLPLTTTIASDTLQFSNNPEKYTDSTGYAKKKEIKLNAGMSTIRIKFSLLNDLGGSYTSYGKIYLNGVAIGTERSTHSTTYVEYSEDLAINVKVGDLLQIYCKTSSASSGVYVCNFRIYYDVSTTVCVSQDPA
jgi:hypothetical protein